MTKPQRQVSLCISAWMICVAAHAADPVYVTNQFRIGLHEEKSTDSPIVKVVATGTRLELVKRDEDASFVRASDGTTGWVDNSYLLANPPAAGDDLAAALERESQLQQRIEELESQPGGAASASQGGLEQQLKSERIKVGELQVQLAQLRKRLGQNSDTDALYQKLDRLEQEKKNLEVRLAAATRDAEDAAGAAAPDAGPAAGWSWRAIAAGLGALFVFGLGLGIYLMDLLNRRRHGGFRV